MDISHFPFQQHFNWTRTKDFIAEDNVTIRRCRCYSLATIDRVDSRGIKRKGNSVDSMECKSHRVCRTHLQNQSNFELYSFLFSSFFAVVKRLRSNFFEDKRKAIVDRDVINVIFVATKHQMPFELLQQCQFNRCFFIVSAFVVWESAFIESVAKVKTRYTHNYCDWLCTCEKHHVVKFRVHRQKKTKANAKSEIPFQFELNFHRQKLTARWVSIHSKVCGRFISFTVDINFELIGMNERSNQTKVR